MLSSSSSYLSILIAHKLRMDAVHNNTSNDIQISQSIHPNCHEPENNLFIEFVIIPLSFRINVYVMSWCLIRTLLLRLYLTHHYINTFPFHIYTFETILIRNFIFILYLFNKAKFVAECL